MNRETALAVPNGIVSAVVAVGLAFLFIGCEKTPAPVVTFTEPQDGYSVKARTITIKGTVTPADSAVRVSGASVIPDKNGNFVGQAQLPNEGPNRVAVIANNGEVVTTYITIVRIFTDEEKAAKAKAAAEKAAADAKAKAQEKAKEAAFLNSRAGKLCAKYPKWTRDDCQRVADHKYWIGMRIEMLKANRGQPDHANPSDYGYGRTWQWCWSDYTPSCFYGGDDGIITSYN